MTVWWIALMALSFWGLRPRRSGYYEDCLGQDQCLSIKGIFILAVLIMHSSVYVAAAGCTFGRWDALANLFSSQLGQMVVVMFLFYSGYGVIKSIETKGLVYVAAMPKRRLLVTLLNFDVAVLAYFVVGLLIGRHFDVSHVALALTGWTSLGNSNWYIFVILLCYALTYLNYRLKGNVWTLLVGCCLMILTLSNVKEPWWSNTILAYPAGAVFATYEKPVLEIWQRYYWRVMVVVATSYVMFARLKPGGPIVAMNIMAVLFAFLVVGVTMRCRIGNPFLKKCGQLLFPIYIYQRLPLIVLSAFLGVRMSNGLYAEAFLLASYLLAILIAFNYHHIQVKIGKAAQ